MKKRNLLLIGMITALLLTGCQTNTNDTENEALRQQITKLEQQVTALEQQTSTESETAATATTDELTGNDTAAEQSDGEGTTAEAAPVQTDPTENTASDPASGTTTRTMEELTSLVEAYEEKAKSAAPTGSASDDMEQFFSLKQEEDQIDDALDLHEDELEYLYRTGALTREEYKSLERELDRLEDRLDAAEDRLEITFGIDD